LQLYSNIQPHWGGGVYSHPCKALEEIFECIWKFPIILSIIVNIINLIHNNNKKQEAPYA
jgi:hypothetical protein